MSRVEVEWHCSLTFFANKTVIPVVRVVCIPQTTVRVLELEEFVSVFA